MTKQTLERLKKAKILAVKNPPQELRGILINTSKLKERKSSTKILLEMRYGCRG